MLIDRRLDPSFLIVGRLVEIRLKSPRHIDPGLVQPPKEQLLNFRVIHPDSQLTTEFPGHLHDLIGITHLAMTASCLGGPGLLPTSLGRRCRHNELPQACLQRRALSLGSLLSGSQWSGSGQHPPSQRQRETDDLQRRQSFPEKEERLNCRERRYEQDERRPFRCLSMAHHPHEQCCAYHRQDQDRPKQCAPTNWSSVPP